MGHKQREEGEGRKACSTFTAIVAVCTLRERETDRHRERERSFALVLSIAVHRLYGTGLFFEEPNPRSRPSDLLGLYEQHT